MADISTIEIALVSLVASWIFPASPAYQNGAISTSTLGPSVKLYRGWPNPQDLDADLMNGACHVTVFSDPTPARLTTRYELQWSQSTAPAPTFLASVTGRTVTFSGTASTSNVVGVQLNNYQPVAYRLQAGDTPTSVATLFAGLLTFAEPVQSGATLTFPQPYSVVARSGADVVSTVETRRQEQTFRITVWAPNPTVRDQIMPAIDNQFAALRAIALPDGTTTNVPKCRGTFVDDVPQKAHEWRRDVRYSIEFPTMLTQSTPVAIFPVADTVPLPNSGVDMIETQNGTGVLQYVAGPEIPLTVP